MLQETLDQGRTLTDAALDRLIPLETEHPVSIHKAMRHSVFAGGKRLRPVLCMEAGRMIAESFPNKIEELGAALEMLHTYSLIHDDLPALDNDDLRRGRPTCHKVFGEAIAILAGDALQTRPMRFWRRLDCPPEARVRIIEEIAHGTGTIDGMIGGQVVDLEAEHTKPTPEMLEYIHRAKTAALITASLVSGGIYAGAKDGDVEPIARLRSVHRTGLSNRGRRARRDPDFRTTRQNRRQRYRRAEGHLSRAVRHRGIRTQGRLAGEDRLRGVGKLR